MKYLLCTAALVIGWARHGLTETPSATAAALAPAQAAAAGPSASDEPAGGLAAALSRIFGKPGEHDAQHADEALRRAREHHQRALDEARATQELAIVNAQRAAEQGEHAAANELAETARELRSQLDDAQVRRELARTAREAETIERALAALADGRKVAALSRHDLERERAKARALVEYAEYARDQSSGNKDLLKRLEELEKRLGELSDRRENAFEPEIEWAPEPDEPHIEWAPEPAEPRGHPDAHAPHAPRAPRALMAPRAPRAPRAPSAPRGFFFHTNDDDDPEGDEEIVIRVPPFGVGGGPSASGFVFGVGPKGAGRIHCCCCDDPKNCKNGRPSGKGHSTTYKWRFPGTGSDDSHHLYSYSVGGDEPRTIVIEDGKVKSFGGDGKGVRVFSVGEGTGETRVLILDEKDTGVGSDKPLVLRSGKLKGLSEMKGLEKLKGLEGLGALKALEGQGAHVVIRGLDGLECPDECGDDDCLKCRIKASLEGLELLEPVDVDVDQDDDSDTSDAAFGSVVNLFEGPSAGVELAAVQTPDTTEDQALLEQLVGLMHALRTDMQVLRSDVRSLASDLDGLEVR